MTQSQPVKAPATKAGTAAIMRLGAPLIAFFLIQNLANLAALAFVGRLGDAVLAGVGVASVIYGVVLALMSGFDTGVQALVSRATGAGDKARAGEILIDALAASAPLGALICAAVWLWGPAVLAGMLHDPAAVAAGAANLRWIAPSLALLGLTIPVNAAWIGSGRPALAFLVTAVTAPAQVLLTALLVLGAGPIPALGAAGAGAAGTLDCLIGALLQLALVLRFGLVKRWRRPDLGGVARIVAIGWPVSGQQSLLQFGIMIAYAIVAQLGTASAAVISVLVNLTLITINTAMGFGVASATLVGQSLGRGRADEARTWGWRAARIGVLATAPLGLAAALAPAPLLGLFLHDPATLALAVWPMRILGLAVAADTAGRVLSFAFRGAGATKIAAGVPFVSQSLLLLPLIWWVGVRLGQGVLGIVWVQATLTLAESAALIWLWRGDIWARATEPGPPPLAGVRRIAILGGGGAGKSTLGRRLGDALGLPVIHLDRLVYGPGWTRLPPEVFAAALADQLTGDAWVVDGTYAEASALTLPRAELVLWLDQPVWRRLWRSWRKVRNHRGRLRADRPDGCEEAFGWRYVGQILAFGHWSGGLERRLAAATPAPVVRLRGDRAISRLVRAAAQRQPQVSRAPILRAATGPVRGVGGAGRSAGTP
jgi:putative MATE family efflux protein